MSQPKHEDEILMVPSLLFAHEISTVSNLDAAQTHPQQPAPKFLLCQTAAVSPLPMRLCVMFEVQMYHSVFHN